MGLLQKHSNLLLIFIILILTNCSSDENELQVIENKYLLSSSRISTVTANQVTLLAPQFGLTEVNDLLVDGFSTYRIEYQTVFLGETITASGLISVPTSEGPFPLASLQHGTIAANEDAPSVNPTDNILLSAIASAGYISIVPDFIGFGSSVDKVHPYYFEPHIATPIVDMIRAAKEFLNDNDLAFEDKLFLGGYSEGGYATMVTHKLIETSFSDEFDLIASAPASGAYDIKHMQEYFFSLDTYHNPFYMAYVGLSYQNVLGENFISMIFQEPYASSIPALFDGTNSGGEINAELTNKVSDLLTADFLTNFDTDMRYSQIRTAFLDNSPVSWIPKSPMYMYHGTADITVPYDNSIVTYDKLISAGASQNVVELIPLEGKTHSTGVLPYFIDVLRKFDALK